MRKIQLVTTTATYANKAKSILKNHGISAEVKKAQGGTAAGCLYGVVLSADEAERAKAILDNENIRIISEREVKL